MAEGELETKRVSLISLLSDLWNSPIHPTRRMDFDAAQLFRELSNIRQRHGSSHMQHNSDGSLHIFHYGRQVQNRSRWNAGLLLARGLIFRCHPDRDACPQKVSIVATPWPKFFNLGEDKVRLEHLVERSIAVEVSGKMDGSLGIVFFDHEVRSWRVTTKGSFASIQGSWATDWVQDPSNCDLRELDTGWTLLVEIIYPENRIVVSYNFQKLVLLSAFREDGTELRRRDLEALVEKCRPKNTTTFRPFISQLDEQYGTVGAERSGFALPKMYSIERSLEKQGSQEVPSSLLLPTIRRLIDSVRNDWNGFDREGVVMRFIFENGASHRVKVKGLQYLQLHKAHDNFSEEEVWASGFLGVDHIGEDAAQAAAKDAMQVRNAMLRDTRETQEAAASAGSIDEEYLDQNPIEEDFEDKADTKLPGALQSMRDTIAEEFLGAFDALVDQIGREVDSALKNLEIIRHCAVEELRLDDFERFPTFSSRKDALGSWLSDQLSSSLSLVTSKVDARAFSLFQELLELPLIYGGSSLLDHNDEQLNNDRGDSGKDMRFLRSLPVFPGAWRSQQVRAADRRKLLVALRNLSWIRLGVGSSISAMGKNAMQKTTKKRKNNNKKKIAGENGYGNNEDAGLGNRVGQFLTGKEGLKLERPKEGETPEEAADRAMRNLMAEEEWETQKYKSHVMKLGGRSSGKSRLYSNKINKRQHQEKAVRGGDDGGGGGRKAKKLPKKKKKKRK